MKMKRMESIQIMQGQVGVTRINSTGRFLLKSSENAYNPKGSVTGMSSNDYSPMKSPSMLRQSQNYSSSSLAYNGGK